MFTSTVPLSHLLVGFQKSFSVPSKVWARGARRVAGGFELRLHMQDAMDQEEIIMVLFRAASRVPPLL
jgi:hypothetical protein